MRYAIFKQTSPPTPRLRRRPGAIGGTPPRTGLAAALPGFALGNDVLVFSGALVGASGTLFTLTMGKAMNRSVANVLLLHQDRLCANCPLGLGQRVFP